MPIPRSTQQVYPHCPVPHRSRCSTPYRLSRFGSSRNGAFVTPVPSYPRMTEPRMSRAGAAYIALRGSATYISRIINLIYLNGQFRFAY